MLCSNSDHIFWVRRLWAETNRLYFSAQPQLRNFQVIFTVTETGAVVGIFV